MRGVVLLERDLVGVLERPEFDRVHRRLREQQQDGFLHPLVHDHLVVHEFGDSQFATIELRDDAQHEVPRLGSGRLAAPFPQLVDLGFQVGHRPGGYRHRL